MKEIIINDRHFIVEDYTEPKVFYNENADDFRYNHQSIAFGS